MQISDSEEFDRGFLRLCAGFDTPPTQVRKDAYWQAFRTHSVAQFTALIDRALREGDFETMPSVTALRKLGHKKTLAPVTPTGKAGPTIQEQLCQYAAHRLHGHIAPNEYSLPWTYVYREWQDPNLVTQYNHEGRGAECTGVVIELANGDRLGFSTAQMLADVEGHEAVLRSFKPGPKPSAEQMAAYHAKLPDLTA